MSLPVEIGGSTSKYLKKAIKAGMSETDFSRLYQELKNI